MAQVGRGDPTREPMAGAGHLLAQDGSAGSYSYTTTSQSSSSSSVTKFELVELFDVEFIPASRV